MKADVDGILSQLPPLLPSPRRTALQPESPIDFALSRSQNHSQLFIKVILEVRTTLTLVKKAILAPSQTVSVSVRRWRWGSLWIKILYIRWKRGQASLRYQKLGYFMLYLGTPSSLNSSKWWQIIVYQLEATLQTPKPHCSRAGYHHPKP